MERQLKLYQEACEREEHFNLETRFTKLFKQIFFSEVRPRTLENFRSKSIKKKKKKLVLLEEYYRSTGLTQLSATALSSVDLPRQDSTLVVPYDSKVQYQYGDAQGSPLFESAEMNSIPSPDFMNSYISYLPEELQKSMSCAQVEAVFAAGCANNKIVAERRRGFLLGDAMGVGKGRASAAIVLDALYRAIQAGDARHPGQGRAVWFSSSYACFGSAQRDFSDILRCLTNPRDPLFDEEKNSAIEFPLYSLKDQTSKTLEKNCNGHSCIFSTYNLLTRPNRFKDLVKYASEGHETEKSQPLFILDECHRASNCDKTEGSKCAQRIMELQHLFPNSRIVYVSGTPTSQYPGRWQLFERLGLWGAGTCYSNFQDFLDTIFKSKNSYTHSGLKEMLAMQLKAQGSLLCRMLRPNDSCTMLPLNLTSDQLLVYEQVCDITQELRKFITGKDSKHFEADLLKIFEMLLTSFKATNILPWIKEVVRSKEGAVVISLESTGESNTIKHKKKRKKNTGGCIHVIEYWIQKVSASGVTLEFLGDHPNFLTSLPSHALDVIVNGLIKEQISFSEVTGRSERWIDEDGVFETWDKESAPTDFREGLSDVLILSACQSEGVSYHADERNPKVRYHTSLELISSATSMFQQFGRTDRNGQVHPPRYFITRTQIPGENRFVSGMIENFKQMGTIRGNRDLIGPMGGAMEEDWRSKAASIAIKSVLDCSDVADIMKRVGVDKKKEIPSKIFFNRMLGLQPDLQDEVFRLLLLEYRKNKAKEHISGNVSEYLCGEEMSITNREEIYTEVESSAACVSIEINYFSGCRFETAETLEGSYFRHKNGKGQRMVKILPSHKDSEHNVIVFPVCHYLRKTTYIRRDKLKELYEEADEDIDVIARVWEHEYELSKVKHVIHLLTGLWTPIVKHLNEACDVIKKSKVVIDKQLYVGIVLNPNELKTLKSLLSKKPLAQYEESRTWWMEQKFKGSASSKPPALGFSVEQQVKGPVPCSQDEDPTKGDSIFDEPLTAVPCTMTCCPGT